MVFPTAAGGLSPYGAGMDASSVFEVGSITKTFAATVLSEIGLSVARPTEPLRRSGSCTDPRRRPMRFRIIASSSNQPVSNKRQPGPVRGAALEVSITPKLGAVD